MRTILLHRLYNYPLSLSLCWFPSTFYVDLNDDNAGRWLKNDNDAEDWLVTGRTIIAAHLPVSDQQQQQRQQRSKFVRLSTSSLISTHRKRVTLQRAACSQAHSIRLSQLTQPHRIAEARLNRSIRKFGCLSTGRRETARRFVSLRKKIRALSTLSWHIPSTKHENCLDIIATNKSYAPRVASVFFCFMYSLFKLHHLSIYHFISLLIFL